MVLGLAVAALVVSAAFNGGLLIVALLHIASSSTIVVYLFIALFIGSIVSAFIISPILVYQFRKNWRLQSGINHFVRNRMQEIVLRLENAQSEFGTSKQSSDETKMEMLNEIRALCLQVSDNLPKQILDEAPNFDSRIVNSSRMTQENTASRPN